MAILRIERLWVELLYIYFRTVNTLKMGQIEAFEGGKDINELTVVQVVGEVGNDDNALGRGKLGVVHLTWV